MKKNIFIVFGLGFLIVFAVLMTLYKNNFSLVFLSEKNQKNADKNAKNGIDWHNSRFFEYKDAIQKAIGESDKKNPALENQEVRIGITSHHLPTAAPLIADLYRTLANSGGSRNTFVIIGPDHFERCPERITLGKEGFETPFGKIGIDEKIENALESGGFRTSDQCLEGEHSIGVQSIFIKYFFPEAKIVPIILSSSARDSEIKNLEDILFKNSQSLTIIISVDFSHHNDFKEAMRLDRITEKMIQKMDSDSLDLKYVDSPPSLKIAIGLAQKMGYNQAEVISRANTFDFTNKPQDVTGYMSIAFKK
jgi:MEMO1 family protein